MALVLCGGGNNGGDGFVAARILHQQKFPVKVWFFKPEQSLKGETLKNFERLKKCGAALGFCADPAMIRDDLANCGTVVDALLGTGFKGAVTGILTEVIEQVNRSGKPVIAVDVPSGMNADTGLAEGPCVRARVTVAMGALKTGFLSKESVKWTGEVIVADIGFPEHLFANQ